MQYRGLHSWVERKLGKPNVCWKCGDTTRKRYAWANKSGEYKQDLADWIRLCYPCHQRMDGFGFKKGYTWPLRSHCKKGHKISGDNLYIRPSTGYRHCKQCIKLYQKLYRSKNPKKPTVKPKDSSLRRKK